MPPGPKPNPLALSEAEHGTILGLLRRRSTPPHVALRARIVLACADPQATNTAIARQLGISYQNVVHWRRRFHAQRLDGLGDEAIERLIALALETQPAGATHWSRAAWPGGPV